MNNKLIDDLFIASTAGALNTYYSSAVPIGGDNGVMIELWVNTLGGSLDTPGISLHAEGSNDGVNFDSTAVVSTGPVTTGPSWTVGPASGVTVWRVRRSGSARPCFPSARLLRIAKGASSWGCGARWARPHGSPLTPWAACRSPIVARCK